MDLADRLMPAFDTPTGVPLSWVNLRKGQVPGDVRATCTACAGTLLLEFGVLSRLVNDSRYEAAARHAVERLFSMRRWGGGAARCGAVRRTSDAGEGSRG